MSIPEFTFSGEPLSDNNMGVISGFLLNRDKEEELSTDELLNKEFTTKLVLKRFEAYDLKFKITNFFLVASLTTFADNPAKIMIMLWFAFKYWKRTNKELIGIEDWCHIFPMGTPTDEELKVMWDSQKGEGEPIGNMLDNSTYWV